MTALRLGSRRAAVTPAGASAPTSRRVRRPKPARLLSRPSRVVMWGGLLLGLAVYVLFGIVPMIGNVIISFTDYTGLRGAPVHNIGFANYTSMGSTQGPGFNQAVIAFLRKH